MLDATIGVLVREGQRDNSHTEAEIGGMWPKTEKKKRKKVPVAIRSQKRQRKNPPLEPPKKAQL